MMFDATPAAQPSPAQPSAGPRGRYWWSPFELLLLREHYPVGGYPACKPLLPDRSATAIYRQARQLGLRAARGPGKRTLWPSTPFMDAAIIEAYAKDGRRGMVKRLGKTLHRPAWWVSHRAKQLGIIPPRFAQPPWSDREIELIVANAKKKPVTISRTLARHGFHRTPNAVKIKLNKLHVDCTNDDCYTGNGLAELMGVNCQKVKGWIDKGWLRARQHLKHTAGSPYEIHRKDVRRFIIENVGAIDIRRVDKHWFVDLVAGSD